MKKSKKFASKLSILGAFIVLGSTGIIAASCTTSRRPRPTYERIVFDQSEVSGKVDYVALGDDYAAGNNNSDNNYSLNEYDANSQKVYGLSYASYFANAINELKDSKTNLRSYKNYGLSGSTIEEWLYILNPTLYEKYEKSNAIKKNFEYNKNLAAKTNSERLSKTFGSFSASDFQRLKSDISSANLITLSVGYNDFFNSNDIFDILLEFHNIDSNIPELEEKLKEWIQRAEQLASIIYENYDRLITEIRRINTNANITLVGYTNPFLKLSSIIKNQFALSKDYVHEGIEILNNKIKAVAHSNSVNFVSYNNEDDILTNPSEYSSNLFEMLPSIKGYKKLAQDLFMKLALGEDEYYAIASDKLGDIDSRGYQKSISFDVQSNNIKSLILGNEGINKRYEFESEVKNKEVIDNQDNSFNSKIFSVYKAQFNNGENMPAFEIIEFFFKSLKILGIDLAQYRETFAQLEAQIDSNNETRSIFIEFINQVFDSTIINEEIKSFNKKTNQLIKDTPQDQITTKDLAKIYYEEFSSTEHIYNFYKEISKTKFLQDQRISREFRQYFKPFFANLTNSSLYKAFFDLLKISIDDKSSAQIDFELQLETFANSLVDSVFDEPNKYGVYANYTEFINALLLRSKVEIKDLLDSFIKWLNEDKEFADKFINSVANSFIELYKIEGVNQNTIREFVRIFFLNFSKLKNIEKLVSFVAETFSDVKQSNSKTPNANELFATFLDNMIADKYDTNNENKLLFTLASANLGQTEEEKKTYQAALEIISLSFIAKEDFFDTKNSNYLENNKKRERLFKLLTNLIKDKDHELTAEGRQLISNILGRLVEQAFLDDKSDLNITIKKLLDYFIIEPLILNFKNTFKKEEQSQSEAIEQFFRNMWNTLWSQIKNKDSIAGIKELFNKVLERASMYDNDSLYAFVISVFKDGPNNKLYDLIKTIFSQLTATEGVFDNTFTTWIQWLEEQTGHTFTSQDKTKISGYLKEVLKNAPNSTLYENIESKVKEIAASLDKNKQKNFEEFSKYFAEQMNSFLTKDNKKIIPEILDVFLARDKDNVYHVEFSKVTEIFSIFFKEDKIIKYVIDKFDIKAIIEGALDRVSFGGTKSQENWGKVLSDLKKFIDDKYTKFIVPTIKSAFKDIFSDENLVKKSRSFTELIVNYITDKKKNLKDEVVKYINELLSEQTNEQLRKNFSELFISLAEENAENASLNDELKNKTQSVITKLLGSFTKFGLTEKLVDIIFENIEKNIKSQLFNFDRYDIKVNLVDIFNGIKHQELIEFVKGLTNDEVKSITLVSLKNWELLLSSIASPKKDSNSSSANKKDGILEISGELKITSSLWLGLLKAVFTKLDDSDKKEIKDELNKILSDQFHTNGAFKKFVKNQLDNIKNKILEQEPLANKLLTKVFDIAAASIEDKAATDLIKSIGNWLADLDGSKLTSITELNKKIQELLGNLKNNFIKLSKKVIKDQVKNKENVKEISGLIFDLINKKYGLTATNINSENIKLFIARLIGNLGDSKIVEDFVDNVVNSLLNINLFTESPILDKAKIVEQLTKSVEDLDFDKTIFSSDNLSALFKMMLNTNEISTLKEEIVSMYQYISLNLPKLKELKEKNKNSIPKVFEKLLNDYKKYVVRAFNSFNKTVKEDNTNKIKNALIDSLKEIAKFEINNIVNEKIDNKYINPINIKKIANTVINYEPTKKIIDHLISEIAKKQLNETDGQKEAQNALVDIITESKTTFIKYANEIIAEIAKDDSLIDILIDEIFRFLSLENTNQDDKNLFKEIIKAAVPKIQQTEFYKNKVIQLFDSFTKKAKNADLANINQLLKEIIDEFTATFNFSDIETFANLIGEGNVIDGPKLVKLINLIFGKSRLENSFIYNALRNINMKDHSKRTTITTLNEIVRGSKDIFGNPINGASKFDPLAILDTIFKLLAQEVTKEFSQYDNYQNDYLVRYDKEAYKATYRMLVSLKFAIFEMFGRETLEANRELGFGRLGLYTSRLSILWEIQEGSGLRLAGRAFKGMQSYFYHDGIRREFTNYLDYKRALYYYYPDEDNYTPSSIDYLIVTSGYNSSEQSKLAPFKYKVTADGTINQISKRDYILLTIKEGGFAKFMKLNNAKSNSEWSGLNTVDFSKVKE
ncbi:SGNH/GDSL hydrolase family protein [Mycoplasma phocoeninasale]|uniref:SGNH/GDSL hydrolase family protein n=1 Tax=Mycoplasma phocoeninasale TaxID=2726117 RepID=UPI001967719C|nr:SGNH/GDSL hydrolase family protein [Mycoplasma phocoeninasale]MBN0970938.1 hypothetical protein [Mycoplasma phocoeninasale]